MWAGTAQAGFLNKSLELSFLGDLMGTLPTTVTGGNSYSGSGIPDGLSVDIGDTSVAVTVPKTADITNSIGVKLSDLTDNVDPITGASGYGTSSTTNTLSIENLTGPGTYTADVTFASVPEPGALYLVALGLMILGMSVYRRRQAVEA